MPEQTVLVLTVATTLVVLFVLLAVSPTAYRRAADRPQLQADVGCTRHTWLVTAHEETGGHFRFIYRCSECGALEIREMPPTPYPWPPIPGGPSTSLNAESTERRAS